jgi:hypothetical protein
MYNENFMGLGGFHWFTGVVEDRQDPLKVGRLKVRILGYHTEDKTILPTEELPWCLVMLPITASGVSGIGNSATGLLEGSWVFGFFKDNSRNQDAVILGSLPGRPTQRANSSQGANKGFLDPNGIYPKYINEPDVNRLAVNLKDTGGQETNPSLALTLRRATRIIGVPTADFNAMINADGSTAAASDGTIWEQPEIPYNATYPYNHVYETESGHIREYDDTPGYERIHERHRSGTSYEISANGTRTDIIKSDHYTLTSGNEKVYIQGNSDTTINGHHKIFINKDGQANNHYDIQVGPGANVNIHVDNGDLNLHSTNGRINMNAGGDYNLKVGGNMTVAVAGEFSQNVNGGTDIASAGTVVIRGDTVNLNP